MKWGWVLVPLALLLVGHCAGSAASNPAPAAPVEISLCGDRMVVERQLARELGQVMIAGWVEKTGVAMLLFASAETDRWTLVQVHGGMACTMRSGLGVAVLGVRNGD